jgi:ubiquinone/menaquinone biosynthesis C-methylase UbiE
MSAMNDPEVVAKEYADDSRFAVRAGAWERATGPDAVALTRAAVAEVEPQRVLEVGCGRGETAEWIARETGAEVIAVDQSEHMVALTRARGIEALVGDVQQLPFADGSFECAVAAWMLYHVPDLELGIAELARVLRPGGRLVAVTNSRRHTQELRDLVNGEFRSSFNAENAEQLLLRSFGHVERRDAEGYVVFEPDEAREYMAASLSLWGGDRAPELDGPIRVTKAPVVFVATKA